MLVFNFVFLFELVSNVLKVNSHTDSELLDAVHAVMCYSWFCYICGVFLVFIVILAYLHTHIMVFVRILIKLLYMTVIQRVKYAG